jgi:hypothetical protein
MTENNRSEKARHTKTLQKVEVVDLTKYLKVRMVNKEPRMDKRQKTIPIISTISGGCQTSI